MVRMITRTIPEEVIKHDTKTNRHWSGLGPAKCYAPQVRHLLL